MADAERISWDHLKARQPSDVERDALQTQLVERAVAVNQHGWDEYRDVWSAGEVAGVAYLLGDAALLEELEEHEGSVLTRFAGDLYGFKGARKEIESGLVNTQAWFDAARKKLGKATT
ncbi:MAG: hypothetical protein JWN03_2480 [Nocardia sp.]|uniref:hypothetical protein n=1 Tax=Nocardia sp. TaxID=1821 RepID=UPI002606A0E7|nr:hypothetical protein [Nocardia sp.]MCU1642205.1 hypothetical protein [Nocardia sp.]